MSLTIEMRELIVEDEKDAARIHQEMMEKDGFTFLLSDYIQGEDFAGYLPRVAAYKDPNTVPEGKVVSTFLVAVIEGKIAGRLSIRHTLNEFLATTGGHIGYGVAPEFRGQGVATYMLRYGIELLKDLGNERIFISCLTDNDHSRRTIEKCGGEFAAIVTDPVNGKDYRTYWIPTGL
jgi:predicted acetyltransferase